MECRILVMNETKDDAKQLLVKFTPRETEVVKEIDYLISKNVLPDNKTEIVRRGIHAVRHLAVVNERSLLEILLEKLSYVIKNPNVNTLDVTLSLSTAILAVMIAKRGVLGAEAFETIPLTLKQMQNIDLSKMNQSYSMETFRGLANSVDTIFLKHHLDNSNKPISA